MTDYQDMLPWDIAEADEMHPDARMLRLEERRRRGLSLTPDERARLNGWLDDLKSTDCVVRYEPGMGFLWVPRTEDHDDIIERP